VLLAAGEMTHDDAAGHLALVLDQSVGHTANDRM
jgi:hypothetical protein